MSSRFTSVVDATSYERRDDARREAFDAMRQPVAFEKIILEEDEFGGPIDTYVFPVYVAVAAIALAISFGMVVISFAPHLISDYFVTLCAGLATLIVVPLSIIAGFREHRKWRSHKALRSLASLDPLTGLMNRRSFSVSLEEELNRMARTGHAAAVILFDLDHFKHLNDRFGHRVGDEVLTEVASLAYSELRNPFDRLARWGGEEFIILLHNMTEDTARNVCERLRERIGDMVMAHGGEDVIATASFGGSLLRPNQAFGEALLHADQALYEAKSRGRNRVEFRRCIELAL
ncbi:MAG: GGDEF domain-containing protein [Pseudomonadota bacterium]